MAILTLIFNKLNVPLEKIKQCFRYSHGIPRNYLGFQSYAGSTSHVESHVEVLRIRDMLDNFCVKKSCTKRELLQLLGHFNFASRVIIPGKSFVSYLLRLASSICELHQYVHLNSECKGDMHTWKLFLEQWNDISFFYDIDRTPADNTHLYTDASSILDFGGYYQEQ